MVMVEIIHKKPGSIFWSENPAFLLASATRLSPWPFCWGDPWLSVPVSRQVWLYRSISLFDFCLSIKIFKFRAKSFYTRILSIFIELKKSIFYEYTWIYISLCPHERALSLRGINCIIKRWNFLSSIMKKVFMLSSFLGKNSLEGENKGQNKGVIPWQRHIGY